MDSFMLFGAPFIVLIVGLCAAFWAAPKDGSVREKD